MACFTDFITYRGSGITPTSGWFVNDLYGFSFTKADAIANTDWATGIEMIDRKIIVAIAYVANELKRYAMPYFKLNSVIAHYLGGEFDDNLTYHTAIAADRGLRIDIKESTLSQIVINKVTVLSNLGGVFNVVVTDGEETEDYEVTLVAQEEQDVEINYFCNRKRVYITIDNTLLQPAEGKVNMDCCSGNYDILDVHGWTGSALSSSHFGIRADVTIICNPGDLFCLMKDYLANAVLYRFGIEMANEDLETDRINFFTLTSRDGILELLERYKEDYDLAMKDIARTMPVLLRKLDDYCIDCNQDKYIESIP